jgi:teichuronic acid biosynthesis glycosyltransferase TuaC
VFLNGFRPGLFGKVNKQEARNKLALPKNKKIILTIGNLEKVKGYDVLIEALKIVKKKQKDFLCIHIGAGTQEKNIEKMIRKYNLERNFKLLGRKPHHELKDWYGVCDFFVSPSRFETGPVVMFEALACGRPFLGTKVGAAPDVVISDDYGKLSEPENSEQLAENILWVLEKDWDSDKILEYSKQFSWNNTVSKILKIYEKLLCS